MLDKKREKFIEMVNQTLFELWIGEIFFGILCQLVGIVVGVCILKRPVGLYSIGLWIGVLTAGLGSYHMWYSLEIATTLPEKEAGKMMGTRYLIRYVALIIVLGVLYYTNIGNAFAAFLGYMSMKAAAYLQPFTHKLSSKIYRENLKTQEKEIE